MIVIIFSFYVRSVPPKVVVNLNDNSSIQTEGDAPIHSTESAAETEELLKTEEDNAEL